MSTVIILYQRSCFAWLCLKSMFSDLSVLSPHSPPSFYLLWLRPLRSCTSEPLTPSAETVHRLYNTVHCTQLLKLHPEETEERERSFLPSTSTTLRADHHHHPHHLTPYTFHTQLTTITSQTSRPSQSFSISATTFPLQF